MAACISSLGHEHSFKKFNEVFKLPQKRYVDFCNDNYQLENYSNKRLKFSHDNPSPKLLTASSFDEERPKEDPKKPQLGYDQYSFKKFDQVLGLPDSRGSTTVGLSCHSPITQVVQGTELSHCSNKLPYLKMVAGSLYLPKENPTKSRGEDAHFIHKLYQTIGVADGVGGWASKGVDAGIYARELMRNSLIAIDINEPKGTAVNPKRILQAAYKNTNSEGSSTACIISLDSEKNTLCAANVGDSGFFLIRNGRVIYKSPIQQRRFNCPYQLGNAKDNPRVAQEMEIIVEKDDVLVVGTDGLLDNMNESEIEELVQRGIDVKLKPKELASQIGNVALYNSFDRFADTPFGRAAEREWLSHRGGKVDDITVIVACIQ
ncbi:putative protein phosphatase 2C 55 [Nicotiana tabacum]|uniref:putative protein phosphatase 2C 55 n=1 Tax=Nicotiana tabacum TaxID=4097 RepID=UPI003F4E668A